MLTLTCFSFQLAITITNGGFLHGQPCTYRNTVYVNSKKTDWNNDAHCVDITQLRSKDLEKKLSTLKPAHTLYADGMNLRQIPYGIITSLPYLELMDFSRNKITQMAPNLFQRNALLKKLILADNYVKIFVRKPLLRHKGITDLVLTKNRLKSLPYYTFRRLPALESLFLNDNELQNIPDNLFDRLHKLTYLNIENNPLKTVPYAKDLPKSLLYYKYTKPKNYTNEFYYYY